MSAERKGSNFLDWRVTRRGFIKGGAAVEGTAAASLWNSNEIHKAMDGIETPNGFFIPLYENHDKGIKDSHIPGDLNIFFKEFVINTIGVSPSKVLFTGEIKPKRLTLLARQNTEVMSGDIALGDFQVDQLIRLSEVAASIPLSVALEKQRRSTKGELRRKLIKFGTIASLMWSLSHVVRIPSLFALEQDNMVLRRVTARMGIVESYAHPEHYGVFFRSLVWATKLLAVAEEYRSRTGEKAKVGFNVGGGHSEIEDFLQLGGDFCRRFILSYPSFFLRHLVEANSGVTNFSTARIFKLPAHLRSDDEEFDMMLEETTERVVIDRQLEQGLRQKLSL